MTVKELRTAAGMTQAAFAEYFGIPKRTIESWEALTPTAKRACPPYLLELMIYKLQNEHRIIESRQD